MLNNVQLYYFSPTGGRIPSVAAAKISALSGNGKKAITLVVYGTCAYEDALLELNNVANVSPSVLQTLCI